MTSQEILDITCDRLARWQQHFVREHSTPLVLVGCGHDHVSGQITVCTLEDLPTAQIVAFLRRAADDLEAMDEHEEDR